MQLVRVEIKGQDEKLWGSPVCDEKRIIQVLNDKLTFITPSVQFYTKMVRGGIMHPTRQLWFSLLS